jgi:hypothetical protein
METRWTFKSGSNALHPRLKQAMEVRIGMNIPQIKGIDESRTVCNGFQGTSGESAIATMRQPEKQAAEAWDLLKADANQQQRQTHETGMRRWGENRRRRRRCRRPKGKLRWSRGVRASVL